MRNTYAVLAAVTVLAGCATLAGCVSQKDWAATGGSRSDGTVKISYEYGKLEIPQVDEQQGNVIAKSRCSAWGYSGAEAFGGSVKVCNQSSLHGCDGWLVTREYQCTGTPQK